MAVTTTDRYWAGSGVPVARGTALWDAAWAALAQHIRSRGWGDGSDLFQDGCGEGWQLMDASRDDQGVIVGFRHRHHPATQVREYACLELD